MKSWRQISLAAQVFVVLLATFFIGQFLTIAAIFLAPPPGPVEFTYAQIASALEGRPTPPSGARRLTSRLAQAPPRDLASPNRETTYEARAESEAVGKVARALGVEEASLRINLRPSPALMTLTAGPRRRSVALELKNTPWAGSTEEHAPAWATPTLYPRVTPVSIRGEFGAALRRTDGRWVVVEPSPELEGLRRLAIWILGGALLVTPIAYWFARRISAPLRRFAAGAERLGRAQNSPPLEMSGSAEIAVAAEAFNAMQTRISRFVDDRVGMMGAISHDLRTPLTRIRFKVEKAPPALRKAVLSDVTRMEVMLTGVLAFIRDNQSSMPRERLDLASLVACAVDDAAAAGSEVTMTLDDAVIVEADPVALQRVFDNLISNAVKYGDRARVTVGGGTGEARILIEDDGPGLPTDELERVFAPFYRIASAKASAEGVGLGLAVARTVVRSHGGEVILRNGAVGLIAEVVLPLASA
jgi:signal transduction histidine kinase